MTGPGEAVGGYLLDTSVVNRLSRSRSVVERVGALADDDVRLFRCTVTDMEVLRGTDARRYAPRRTDLGASFDLLDVNQRILREAQATQGRLAERPQHQGVKVPDLIIAACAAWYGATVLHYDSDYDTIAGVTPDLSTEWVVPPGEAD